MTVEAPAVPWQVMWSSRAVISGGPDATATRVTDRQLSIGFAGPGAVMFGRRIEDADA